MAEVGRFELSAHARLGGVRAFGAVGIAEGGGRGVPVGVGGDQSVVRAVDVEDRTEGCEVDREVADPRVVEDAEVRAHGLRLSPRRRVLVELLEARRHGRLGWARLRSRRRSGGGTCDPKARSRWSGAICPGADAADVDGAALVAAGQAQQGTPDESAGEAEIAVAKRAVALDHPRAEVAQARAEPQLVHRTGLAQAIVHDTGWRGVRETDGIDAHSHAHARQHRIVQRRGAAEVRIIDAVGAAVVEVEAADLGLAVEARLLGAHAFAEGVGGGLDRAVLRRCGRGGATASDERNVRDLLYPLPMAMELSLGATTAADADRLLQRAGDSLHRMCRRQMTLA